MRALRLSLVSALALALLSGCGSNSNATITVAKSGAGAGTVTSAPAGISCGSTCSASFADGTAVTLTAAADAGSKFSGWSGACTGSLTCALTARGSQSVAAVFVVATGAPGAPTGVTAEAGDASATVRWTAPADTGGMPLTGFVVKSTPGSVTVNAAAGATSALVTGLTNGTAYTFTVEAQNAIASSSPVQTAAVTPRGKPLAVTGLTGTPGNGQVTLSWTAANGNGAPVTGYTATATPGPLTRSTTSTTLVFDQLVNGTAYSFTVFATNVAGDGPASTSTVVTPATVPGAPGAATVGSRVVGGVELLGWSVPTSTGGAAITAYKIYKQKTGDAAFSAATATVDAAARTALVSGLANGGTYLFRVSAVNSRGEGAQGPDSAPVTMFDVPGAPTGAVASTTGAGVVKVDWVAPAILGDPPLTKYAVIATPSTGTAVRQETADASTTLTFTGLRNGINWTAQVYAINAAGESAASSPTAPIMPGGPPEAPVILSGTVGVRSIVVSVQAPLDGGTPITSYSWLVSTGGAYAAITPSSTDPVGSPTFTATFGGLVNDTNYSFKVVAANAVGPGPESAVGGPFKTPGLPLQPVFLSVKVGDNQLTPRWADAQADVGFPILSYAVKQTQPTAVDLGTTTSTQMVVLGLTNGLSYRFTVQATNAVGVGPLSAESPTSSPHVPCGDGQLNPGEQCDASAPDNVYECNADCTYKAGATCGNGKREYPEQCDNGAGNGPGTGCEYDCTTTVCPDDHHPTAPASGELCAVDAAPAGADGSKLFTGTVLASVNVGGREQERVFGNGQVLVDATGKITCAGCNCSAATGADKARVISCAGAVISPGLINTHDHITFQDGPNRNAVPAERFEHRHDWRPNAPTYNGHSKVATPSGGATVVGEIRQLMAGTTSVVGSGGAHGLLRNLDDPSAVAATSTASSQEGLGEGKGILYSTFPLGDSSTGKAPVGTCTGYSADQYNSIPFDSCYLPHVAEGIDAPARNEFACFSGAIGTIQNLLSRKTAIVHGIGLQPNDIQKMAQKGSSLVWSPRSNLSLYGDTARVQVYRRLGVNVALGTDWLESGSMNVLRELRCAEAFASAYTDANFGDLDYFRMVTSAAADAMQVEEKIGRIVVGKVADLAVFRNKTPARPYRAILDANPEDVIATFRGGKLLYGENTLAAAFGAVGCESVEGYTTQVVGCPASFHRKACVQDEIGTTLAILATSATSTLYPLAFCAGATPTLEPKCEAKRDNTWCGATGKPCQAPTYTGIPVVSSTPAASDSDGDGVMDDVDNCKFIFNPIRPQDCATPGAPGSGCVQEDSDGDGVGDACDLCPTVADDGHTPCPSAPNPRDQDGDGLDNAFDTCPSVASATQVDSDGDGIADACDPCPGSAWDAATSTCTTDIYAMKTRFTTAGDDVSILQSLKVTFSGIVTGVATGSTKGMFVQVDPSTPGYPGPEKSGVFYFTTATPAAIGSKITVTGATVGDFYGQTQVSGGTFTSVSSTLPTPVDALASEVKTGGARAQALESVFVRVSDALITVTDPSPTSGPRDSTTHNEFEVNGSGVGNNDGLRVNDLMYLVPTLPLAQGTRLLSLQGVLELRNGNSKIEPRVATDIDFGAVIYGLGPAGTFTSKGHALAPTFPQKLQISLPQARPVSTTVHVQAMSAELSLVGPSGSGGETVDLVIPSGSTTVDVPVSGLAQAASVTIKAWAQGDQSDAKTTTVRVLDYASETPAVATFTPSTFSLATGGQQALTVTTNIPVSIDTSFTLGITNPTNFTTQPTSVVVPAERSSTTFTLTAATSVPGTSVLTLDAAGANLSSTATFTGGVADCVKGQVVISQVYGGGGNTSSPAAVYKNDYVELFNRAATSCKMTGWNLQYASAASAAFSTSSSSTFSGTIPAHGYFLVGQAQGSGGSANLPTPDATGTLTLGAAAGKVLLVGGAPLGICPATSEPSYIDLVAYGSATVCFEGSAGPGLSNNTAAVRNGEGCTDTDNNGNDFTALKADPTVATGNVQPRNSTVTGPSCP